MPKAMTFTGRRRCPVNRPISPQLFFLERSQCQHDVTWSENKIKNVRYLQTKKTVGRRGQISFSFLRFTVSVHFVKTVQVKMTFWEMDNVHDVGLLACIISCILSFAGSLMIIVAYCLIPKLRKPARRLILWLSVADLGTTTVFMLNLTACSDCQNCSQTTQLFFTISGIFWPVASCLWTDCIGLYIYGASTGKSWINLTKRLFITFHLISWSIPLILGQMVFGLYFSDSYSVEFTSHYTGGWCWVDSLSLQLSSKIVIETMSYGFMLFIHIVTYRRLQRMQRSKNLFHRSGRGHGGRGRDGGHRHHSESCKQSKIKLLFIRLRLIPIIFLITRMPGALRVIYGQLVHHEMIQGNVTMEGVLMVGQAFCEPLQGFCNALLFLCCVSEVKNAIYQDEINASRIVNHVDLSQSPSDPMWPTNPIFQNGTSGTPKYGHKHQKSVMSKMNSEINISYTMTMDVSVDTSSSQYVLHCNLDFADLSYEEPIFVGLVLVSKQVTD